MRFEIDGPLLDASYCHCTRCQRRTGTAASAQGYPERGAFRLVEGEDLVRAYVPPTGGWHKLFCSQCGSALLSRNPDDPEEMSVRLGVIDGDPRVRPSRRQFTDYAAAWEAIPDDGLRRFPESSRGATPAP